ncbi:MAG: hypothetical protein E4H32_10765 [Nitrospirales bacterium]|nr:MAG: hypothetical protein E4H32_10765 [Nitrospirales bacterium]
MITVRHFLIIAFVLILPTFAWGHGDAGHVMGTVTAMETDHVIVKTPKGESLSLAFQPQTIFQHNGIHEKDARPQVGDRLVAEVTKQGVPQDRDWVATEITFSTHKKQP